MRQRSADRLTQEDRRRFEEIFLPYLDAAYNLARWIIRHDQDAQDVVQDAYVRAFKGFQRFRGGGNSKAWFLTIVRNTAYTLLNRRAAEGNLIPYEEENTQTSFQSMILTTNFGPKPERSIYKEYSNGSRWSFVRSSSFTSLKACPIRTWHRHWASRLGRSCPG